MDDYIAYIAPLIISGIAGLTLTSMAFDKIGKILIGTVENVTFITNLGLTQPPISRLSEIETDIMRTLGVSELAVVVSYCLSELSIIPLFTNALWTKFLNNVAFLQDYQIPVFIAISYSSVILGFLISAIVYAIACSFKFRNLPPRLYEEFEEIKERRKQILESA